MVTMAADVRSTWLIVGGSRGIGFEFVCQLIARPHVHVLCAVRQSEPLERLVQQQQIGLGSRVSVITCDVADEVAIKQCCSRLYSHEGVSRLDHVVLNAGMLAYPQRAMEASMAVLQEHLITNALGPIFMANTLLHSPMSIGSLVFMSSDSGSMGQFTGRLEDGFAAYAASKAALNMLTRHLAEELLRQDSQTVVLALHPGEVMTDMAANVNLPWEVQGTMSAAESVGQLIPLIESRVKDGAAQHNGATFWNWNGTPHAW